MKPLSSIIQSCRLTFFGHLVRMDEIADASQAIFKSPPENWRRTPERPHTTWMNNIHDFQNSFADRLPVNLQQTHFENRLTSEEVMGKSLVSLLDLGIHETRDLAQNWPLWRLTCFAQCHALIVAHAATGLLL